MAVLLNGFDTYIEDEEHLALDELSIDDRHIQNKKKMIE